MPKDQILRGPWEETLPPTERGERTHPVPHRLDVALVALRRSGPNTSEHRPDLGELEDSTASSNESLSPLSLADCGRPSIRCRFDRRVKHVEESALKLRLQASSREPVGHRLQGSGASSMLQRSTRVRCQAGMAAIEFQGDVFGSVSGVRTFARMSCTWESRGEFRRECVPPTRGVKAVTSI